MSCTRNEWWQRTARKAPPARFPNGSTGTKPRSSIGCTSRCTPHWSRGCGRGWAASPSSRLSDIDDARQSLDFLEREELPLSGSRTGLLRPLPVLAALEVRVPKRPRAALRGASAVDRAVPRLRVEERAVSVGTLGQRDALVDQPRVILPHLVDRLTADLGHLGEFLFGD